MEVKASAKQIRISANKVRRVLALVRGKNASVLSLKISVFDYFSDFHFYSSIFRFLYSFLIACINNIIISIFCVYKSKNT